jgi:transcriptional regulator with XRE-family HTH domain
MGRKEAPIRASNKALSDLALWLRAQRRRSGLTYAQMAACTGLSPSSLSRAAQGDRVPSRAVVEAFTRGCGGDVRKALSLWRNARYAQSRSSSRTPASLPILPEYIHSFAQLHAAMVELHKRAGSPSLRQLEASEAGKHGRLPHSTLGRVLRGQAVPTKELFVSFIRACSTATPLEASAWEAAWERANDEKRNERILHGDTRDAVGEVQLLRVIDLAEKRAELLRAQRGAHLQRKDELLRSLHAAADSVTGSRFDAHWSSWGQESHSEALTMIRRELLVADEAAAGLQRKIEKTEERLALLYKRLAAEADTFSIH